MTNDLGFRTSGRGARDDRGVAFILVIGVLSGLLVLAAPFLAVALNDREIARKTVDEAEARAYAEGMQRYARAALERTHAWREASRGASDTDPFATPKYDVAEEFAVSLEPLDSQGRPMLGPDGNKLVGAEDPRGRLLDLTVRDEQSLPNLWSASPLLIAASLGRGTLEGDLEVDAQEFSLDSGDGFPLRNGVVYVDGERIGYAVRDGATFRGLQRQLAPSTKTRKVRAETWVLDDRARAIACLPWTSPRAAGAFREPLDVAAVKEVVLGASGLFTPLEIDKLTRRFNVAAWRYVADGWGLPRVLLASVDPATADVTDGFRMRIESATGINPGTVVKITDGQNVDYGFVARVQMGGGGRGGGSAATISLLEPTKVAYLEGRTSVTPLLRHPVNINTASQELLVELMTGIQLTGGRMRGGSDGRVKVAAAEAFATGIVAGRPIKGWEDLRNNLQETVETLPLITSPMDVAAIFRNAIDAGDIQLGGTTVPFCFASNDRYRIEAAVSINDLSGRETARRRVRELVRVAPPETQTFRLSTQQEFERSILAARWSPYFTTYPNPVEVFEPGAEPPFSRAPRMLQFSANSGGAKQAGVFPHTTEGAVRLWPARLGELGGYSEHFDGQAFQQASNIDVADIDPDGFKSENRPFTLPLRDAGQGGGRSGGSGRGGRTAGAFLDRRGPNPIQVGFWLKTGQIGGRQVYFDLAGSNPDEERIQFLKESDGSLRLTIRDRTIPNPATNFAETAEWIFQPDPGLLVPNTNYHFSVAYRGTKPDDGAIFVDGMKRGRAKYATTLSSSVRRGDGSLTCDDLTDWPNYGAAMVGREIVEFTRVGNSLNAIQYPNNGGTGRGRRGTADIDHGAGTPVRLLGYSTPVVSQSGTGGVAVMRGGATLAGALGPFNLASFTHNAVENVSLGPPPLPQLQLEVHDPAKPKGNELELVTAPGCPADFSAFQPSGGYALIVSSFTGAPANILSALSAQGFYSGAELVYYSSRNGAVLSGLSAPNLPHFSGPTVTLAGNTTMSVVRQKHPVSFPSGPFSNRSLVVVFPVSIGLTSVQDYFEPIPPPGVTGGVGGVVGNMAEFVSLGAPDYVDINRHAVEWVRYYHRDTSRNQLLCDDLIRLNNAVVEADLVMANQGGPNAILGPWIAVNDALDFRSQHGTGIFGYDSPLTPKMHSANEDVVPVFRALRHAGIGALPLPANSPPNTPQPQTPSAPCVGWGDSVTLEQSGGGNVRRRYDVSWSAAGDWGHGLVSLGTSPGVDFSQPRLPVGPSNDRTVVTRLLKFPSGELPRITGQGTRGAIGGDVDGSSFSTRIDEIRVAPFDEDRFILWDHAAMGLNSSGTNVVYGSTNTAVDATTDEIPVCNADWIASDTLYSQDPYVTLPDHRRIFHDQQLRSLPRNDAGLVWIDDELIAFREIGVGSNGQPALLKCRRGLMNTTAAPHGYGAEVVFVPFIPVSKLSQACGAQDRDVFVAQTRDFTTEGGLLLVEDELIHFTEIQGGALRMPPRLEPNGVESGGLLRGRFGTRATAHDVDDIVLEMPFRHWDRYAERQDNPELSFYGVSLDAPGAYIESFSYEEFRPNPNVRLRAFVRTEPDQRWSDAPGTGLLAFDEGVAADKPYRIDRLGSICEIRFMARYDGNSYDPFTLTQHEWKSTPELRSLTVRYRDASRVLRRETIK